MVLLTYCRYNVFGLYEVSPLTEFGRVKRAVYPVLSDPSEA